LIVIVTSLSALFGALPAQVQRFDLTAAAPDPTTFDLSAVLPGVQFQATTVRVVASTAAVTTLLVGGVDNTYPAYNGVVIYGSVAAGASKLNVIGSVALPGSGAGVTALSQTSPLHPGFVLAATDTGVYKCADQPGCGVREFAASSP